ncbi:MAG: hypothetical protein CVU55_15640 [Deltaproteobacteria bacterium HGW-Deltaproteobacteria-13]|nr:MAG: hypothetical protein CVU55_15640 [Deltaproteobacteria bacterium HGW-Deltaproteobacteria-13]
MNGKECSAFKVKKQEMEKLTSWTVMENIFISIIYFKHYIDRKNSYPYNHFIDFTFPKKHLVKT